jgi:hypothetical protein
MAIAINYVKFPEALAVQLVLDLAPSAIAYMVKTAAVQMKRCWAGVKAVWKQAQEAIKKTRLEIVALFHNVTHDNVS